MGDEGKMREQIGIRYKLIQRGQQMTKLVLQQYSDHHHNNPINQSCLLSFLQLMLHSFWSVLPGHFDPITKNVAFFGYLYEHNRILHEEKRESIKS